MTMQIRDAEGRAYAGWRAIAREIFADAPSLNEFSFARVDDLRSAEWLDRLLRKCGYSIAGIA